MALDTQYDIPVARTIADLRDQVKTWRKDGLTIGFVPTMGALHAGHVSLVDAAWRTCERVVVSIFVNPTQFAPGEDFEAYPRTEAADVEKLQGKADLVFAPNAAEMYAPDFSTAVTVMEVTKDLEGAARPSHFTGVATVVAKLLLAVLPDKAVFGQKDYQQLLTIKRMVRDLNIPVKIVGGTTLREEDGLAMSSRNAYLSPEERKVAGKLNVILREAAHAVAKGAPIPAATEAGIAALMEAGFASVDYLEIRHAETLDPFASGKPDGPARILVAARIGKTRLIDNMPVG